MYRCFCLDVRGFKGVCITLEPMRSESSTLNFEHKKYVYKYVGDTSHHALGLPVEKHCGDLPPTGELLCFCMGHKRDTVAG